LYCKLQYKFYHIICNDIHIRVYYCKALLRIVCYAEKMFVLLEIHFYVVDNIINIIIILWMRSLVKWFKSYIFQKLPLLFFVRIMCTLVEWFSNFKYYILNYYNSYMYYFKDYFSVVDYLYLLTLNIDIVPMYLYSVLCAA
jgi:hypothetical protein